MLEKLLRSGAEVRVLGVVLFEDGLHLREIARKAGVSSFEAKRELDALTGIGMLRAEKKGNMVLFSVRKECPFAGEVRALYLKTEGIIPLIREKLSKVEGIRYALIFGSFAKGGITGKSDIDVLIIGDADEESVADACTGLQSETHREINYILWTGKDFREKAKGKGAFIRSVLGNRRIWLVGDEDGFRKAASGKAH